MGTFTKNCYRCKFMVRDEDVNDCLCLMNDGATCNLTEMELELEGITECDAFEEGSNDFDKDYDSKYYSRYGEDR